MTNEKLQELQSTLSEINSLLDGLQENFASLSLILASTEASEVPVLTAPKKRGRPPKKKDPIPELPSEDLLGLGRTDPAVAEKLKNRYKPFARSGSSLGPGVKAGTSKDIMGEQKARVDASRPGHVSIDDE